MNTEQKLTKIRKLCVVLIANAESDVTAIYRGFSVAGWHATICAIDNAMTVFDEIIASEIIAAWEGLV